MLAALALTLLVAHQGQAQDLRGTITDSATHQPIGGAVVALLDSAGESLARAISNERGFYRVLVPGRARAIRVVRIGFRPLLFPYTPATGISVLDLGMLPIPPLLEQVTVRAAASCPRRPDRLAALSLLQQARAGLLATIVAREANPATMVRLVYVRIMDGNSDRIAHQEVKIDSTGQVKQSFHAVRSGADFVQYGFTFREKKVDVYLGPDAEVLLDDGFAAGYCFHVSDPARDRPNQIGLRFVPATRKRGRVDIDGTLWIDTVARALRDIGFAYVGVDKPVGAIQPDGRIEFREMGNGVVLIDRWGLRMFDWTPDTAWDNGSARVRAVYHVRESGGEVATASWPNGFTWEGSLGTLRALAVDYRDNPARALVVRLADTDYLASPSARGILEIPHLLPGPYSVLVIDTALARLGITIPTSLRFSAARDSVTERSFTVPRTEEYVRGYCLTGQPDNLPSVVVHVVDSTDKSLRDVNVRLTRDEGVAWQVTTEHRRTGWSGDFDSCLRFRLGDSFEVSVWRDGQPPQTVHAHTTGAATRLVVKVRAIP